MVDSLPQGFSFFTKVKISPTKRWRRDDGGSKTEEGNDIVFEVFLGR